MIELTKLNMHKFMVNPDLIEHIEENPDTVVTMSTGKKFVVRESTHTIRQMILQYKRQIMTPID